MPSKPVYTIGVAAEIAGVSVHTLRLYEKEGLLLPYKKESNQRRYSDKDIERINCIRNAISQDNMTLQGIRRVLALIPCWALVKCSIEDRKNCRAYAGFKKPCWMFDHKNNCCANKICRECEVYNSFSDCGSIKSRLKELLK